MWTKLPREEYDAHPGLRSTDLKLLLKSVQQFKTARFEKRSFEQTPSMRFGDIVHKCVLEPDVYLPKLVVEPVVNKRTNEGKKLLEEFKLLVPPDSIIVSPDELEIFATITDAVRSHPTCEVIFSKGVAEMSGFATCERGVQRKIQPDWRRDDGIIVDLKTTVDASPQGFKRECIKYKYPLQAAYYLYTANLIEPGKYHTWIWAAIETRDPKNPYIKLYQLGNNSYAKAIKQMDEAISIYLNCEQTNTWEDDKLIQSLEFPEYAWEL